MLTDSALTSRLVQYTQRSEGNVACSLAEKHCQGKKGNAGLENEMCSFSVLHKIAKKIKKIENILKNTTVLRGVTVCFEHILSHGLPPKDPEFTASSQEWDKLKECTRSLYRKQHITASGLGEFHTSRGYSVLGSTLTQPRGEINTPAGPGKCV